MGSVSPLGDLQARLQGGERANFREAKFPCHKCSTYSGKGSPKNIIRFGMRTLQAASKALISILLAQLAPSEARISISRTGHHYLHMSNTSAYAGFSLQIISRRAARKGVARFCVFPMNLKGTSKK